MTFDEAFHKLLGHEGGYSDHAADTGGRTMWGVTERVARQHGYTGEMRDLPQAFAKQVYLNSYWKPIKAEELPSAIRFHVFDAAVNSGTGQAIRWLQRAVGERQDGIIGPLTLAAVRQIEPLVLASRYSGLRLRFMTDLSNWTNFGRGWARRIADNLIEVER